ncbi:hypothetical protein VNO78_26772 [Psophocarpus tetragonolobus]|uniref:Uncharacterized protein n=1 Tax=Psophocarpus tetragonolobus TaxID=3891 RepID=A0AAN9S2D3_PSOTE
MPFACNIRLALTGLSKRLWKLRLLCHAIGILHRLLKTKTRKMCVLLHQPVSDSQFGNNFDFGTSSCSYDLSNICTALVSK